MPSKKKTKLLRESSFISEDNVEVDPTDTSNNTSDELLKQTNGFNMIDSSQETSLETSKYSIKYRFVKTALLILAWIVYSLNYEMIGPTFEDLRHYMNVNYSMISLAVVIRNLGFFIVTLLFGLVFDRIAKYSDTFIGFCSFLIAFTNFLIPITRNFVISMLYYFLQGISQAVVELAGNYIILNLWSDISNSPINAMHSGYGIGAILAIQIARPFISFDPYKHEINEVELLNLTNVTQIQRLKLFSNSSVGEMQLHHKSSEEIDLRIPYWIAASTGLLLSVSFFIAQLLEIKVKKQQDIDTKRLILLREFDLSSNTTTNASSNANLTTASSNNNSNSNNNNNNQNVDSIQIIQPTKSNKFIQKLLFSEKFYTGNLLVYMMLQIFLIIVLFIFLSGLNTILSRYMLTYLILGPARLNLETFVAMQTLYWSFFIFGRFMAAYLAYKIDPIKFFLGNITLNLVINFLFLIPGLTVSKLFFWINVSFIGFTNGPLIPSGLMVAKQILDFNSFVLSLFIVGIGLGGVISIQTTGSLMDYFKPTNWLGFQALNSSYLIPHLAFFCSLFSFLFFIPIIFGYYRFTYKIGKGAK